MTEVRRVVTALYAYAGDAAEEELSFDEGDEFVALGDAENGWLEAEINGTRGWVPANYVEIKDGAAAPADSAADADAADAPDDAAQPAAPDADAAADAAADADAAPDAAAATDAADAAAATDAAADAAPAAPAETAPADADAAAAESAAPDDAASVKSDGADDDEAAAAAAKSRPAPLFEQVEAPTIDIGTLRLEQSFGASADAMRERFEGRASIPVTHWLTGEIGFDESMLGGFSGSVEPGAVAAAAAYLTSAHSVERWGLAVVALSQSARSVAELSHDIVVERTRLFTTEADFGRKASSPVAAIAGLEHVTDVCLVGRSLLVEFDSAEAAASNAVCATLRASFPLLREAAAPVSVAMARRCLSLCESRAPTAASSAHDAALQCVAALALLQNNSAPVSHEARVFVTLERLVALASAGYARVLTEAGLFRVLLPLLGHQSALIVNQAAHAFDLCKNWVAADGLSIEEATEVAQALTYALCAADAAAKTDADDLTASPYSADAVDPSAASTLAHLVSGLTRIVEAKSLSEPLATAGVPALLARIYTCAAIDAAVRANAALALRHTARVSGSRAALTPEVLLAARQVVAQVARGSSVMSLAGVVGLGDALGLLDAEADEAALVEAGGALADALININRSDSDDNLLDGSFAAYDSKSTRAIHDNFAAVDAGVTEAGLRTVLDALRAALHGRDAVKIAVCTLPLGRVLLRIVRCIAYGDETVIAALHVFAVVLLAPDARAALSNPAAVRSLALALRSRRDSPAVCLAVMTATAGMSLRNGIAAEMLESNGVGLAAAVWTLRHHPAGIRLALFAAAKLAAEVTVTGPLLDALRALATETHKDAKVSEAVVKMAELDSASHTPAQVAALARDRIDPPALVAARNNNVQQLAALTQDKSSDESSAIVNAVSIVGTTALHAAVEHDNYEMVKLLLSHGASADAASCRIVTPTELAMTKGHVHALRALVEANAASCAAHLAAGISAGQWAAVALVARLAGVTQLPAAGAADSARVSNLQAALENESLASLAQMWNSSALLSTAIALGEDVSQVELTFSKSTPACLLQTLCLNGATEGLAQCFESATESGQSDVITALLSSGQLFTESVAGMTTISVSVLHHIVRQMTASLLAESGVTDRAAAFAEAMRVAEKLFIPSTGSHVYAASDSIVTGSQWASNLVRARVHGSHTGDAAIEWCCLSSPDEEVVIADELSASLEHATPAIAAGARVCRVPGGLMAALYCAVLAAERAGVVLEPDDVASFIETYAREAPHRIVYFCAHDALTAACASLDGGVTPDAVFMHALKDEQRFALRDALLQPAHVLHPLWASLLTPPDAAAADDDADRSARLAGKVLNGLLLVVLRGEVGELITLDAAATALSPDAALFMHSFGL